MVSIGEHGGRIVRPWLGINMQRVTRRPRRRPQPAAAGRPGRQGRLRRAAPARGPGLKRNDVIVRLKRPADRRRGEPALPACATLQVDATVPVKVIRGGKEFVFDMKLAAPPEDPPRDQARARRPPAAVAAPTVVNMSPAVADELGLVEWRPGVIVMEVEARLLCRPLRAARRHDPGRSTART